MLHLPIAKKWWIILGACSACAGLLLYTLLAQHQHAINPDDTTIPTWSQMAQGIHNAFLPRSSSSSAWIADDVKATSLRLALGLGFGVAGAIALGLLMGCFEVVEAALSPALSFLAKVPPTAALAVFFVMAGTGTNMYVAMVAFGILPALAQAVYLAVQEVPDELLNKAYTLGASTPVVICCIVVRYCLPKFLDAVRLQIGPALVYIIAAEMVCGDVGFGYRIRLQSRLLNMNVVYPYLVLLAGFGFAADYALRLLRRVCCPWYVSEAR
jgi:NitT/TauT family transport system permease protein